MMEGNARTYAQPRADVVATWEAERPPYDTGKRVSAWDGPSGLLPKTVQSVSIIFWTYCVWNRSI